MPCGPNMELLPLQGPVTLVFLRPGLRPLWPGGRPTGGLGCIAGFSTFPSASAPRFLGNSTAGAGEIKELRDKNKDSQISKRPLVHLLHYNKSKHVLFLWVIFEHTVAAHKCKQALTSGKENHQHACSQASVCESSCIQLMVVNIPTNHLVTVKYKRRPVDIPQPINYFNSRWLFVLR